MLNAVVVSVNGSEASRAAVQWCVEHLGPGATVVAVCGVTQPRGFGADLGPIEILLPFDGIEHEFRNHWCEPLRRAGLRCDGRFIHTDHAVALYQVAKREHADAIVVGKAPHRAVTDAVLRGPARRLLHRPPCPVLVVPTKVAIARRSKKDHQPGGCRSAHELKRAPLSTAERLVRSPIWSHCRLVLSTREDDLLVLDCLVSTPTMGASDSSSTSVPDAVSVYLPEALDTSLNIEETLRGWIDTGANLDIEFTDRDGTPLVQISHEGSGITLQLVKAPLPRFSPPP